MKTIINSKKIVLFSFCQQPKILLFICFISVFLFSFISPVMANDSNKLVRVGFFKFEGYHESDSQNRRSGYGYEYLHEMAKYTGWIFEYVDGTWDECQEMLKNGKIDLLTSAQYNDARGQLFDFSSLPMGTSYAQLTVADGNKTYNRNEFSRFSGIKIGLLKGNSRNSRLADFAQAKGFSYVATIYNTQAELDSALKTGAVDAVLTSSLRKPKNERIIAQFAPSPFYAIVNKGNRELLEQVNFALESIDMNSPAFRYTLHQEYYRTNTTDTFVLSRQEQEYLDSRPKIRAIIHPSLEPISYWENGKFKGITADIISYLLNDLNIQIEYVVPDSPKDIYPMLASGKADISCVFESDYNLAETYLTRITTPYLKSNYSIIARQQNNQALESIRKIALPEGELMLIHYAKKRYPNANVVLTQSSTAALEAVSAAKVDIALINTYSAGQILPRFPTLRASFVTDDGHQLSIGVSQAADLSLYSILDKKINSINTSALNDTISKHTLFNNEPISLAVYFRQNPLQVIVISLVFFLIIISILFYIMLINKRHAKSIYKLAYVDEPTNLWNTNGFLLNGNRLLAIDAQDKFAVVSIDLINLSDINENYGYKLGAKAINAIGGILNSFGNDKTIVAHSGGSSFFMLLYYNNLAELHSAVKLIAKDIRAYTLDDLTLRFSVHIGVSIVEQQENGLLKAIDYANIARGTCTLNKPIVYMDEALRTSQLREKELLEHVESALVQNEFLIYYQPKVNMSNNKIVGAEALVRWKHKNLGFLPPDEFIPILEKSGIIIEVDFYVLEQVCKLIRSWLDIGQPPVLISVNQSRAHFIKKDYIERLQNMVNKYNIPPGYIELEITETLFGQELVSNTLIKKIKALGFLISIDDFGAGYSSLHLLHQISVDILKIDKKLLDEGDKHEKVRSIIHRIVQIAADLDVDVIVEGIETREQVAFLLGMNCQYAQGFLFSRPLPQAEFDALVKSGKTLLLRDER